MRSVAIHYNPNIDWQGARARDFSSGLKALGIPHDTTESRNKVSDVSILFGTTYWRGVEEEPGYLLVDRASVGDPEYVQLVWDGHGKRGDHKAPDNVGDDRWRALNLPYPPDPVNGYLDTVICGQTETYSPNWASLEDWYDSIPDATHFRPHPKGNNPTGLPAKRGALGLDKYHVLNSSIAVEAILSGLHVQIHDAGSLAYGIGERASWAHWLAYTQWSWQEIAEGEPIRHLFEDI